MFRGTPASVESLKIKIQTLIANERMPGGLRNSKLYKTKEELKEVIHLQKKQIIKKQFEFYRKQNLLNFFKSKFEIRDEEDLKELIIKQKSILQKLKEEKNKLNTNKLAFSDKDQSILKLKNYVVDQILGYDIQIEKGNLGELILFIYSNYSSTVDYHILHFKNGQVISLQSSSEAVKIDTRALSKYLQINQYGRFFTEYTVLKAEQSTIIVSQDYDSGEIDNENI